MIDAIQDQQKEIDRLRAEVERLGYISDRNQVSRKYHKQKREEAVAESNTLRAENERLREALGGVVACHGNNPSDAMADTPEIDYIKYTLMTARRIAKEALNAQETS